MLGGRPTRSVNRARFRTQTEGRKTGSQLHHEHAGKKHGSANSRLSEPAPGRLAATASRQLREFSNMRVASRIGRDDGPEMKPSDVKYRTQQ
jgi:hypothetical protein